MSVLSFSSSSETSVSRISGLDLFPYLRHKKTDTQAIKQKGEIKGLSNNLDLVGFKWKKPITERKRDPAELSTGEIII